MQQKASHPQTIPAPVPTAGPSKEPGSLPQTAIRAESESFSKIRRLMEAGQFEDAIKLARSQSDAPTRNALAVCLMRTGRPDEAVRVYRGLVLDHTGLFLRENVPAVYKVNFAAALMLSGNVMGGIDTLGELKNADHPGIQKLRDAVAAWKSQLSILRRLGLKLGLEPNRPIVLDFPPGDLA
jgi:hypothetical protein